jgi:hypothetical protein
LDIVWIGAHSPQAKGRVERSFQTAQDRLVKGLRVAGATTLEARVPNSVLRFVIETVMAGRPPSGAPDTRRHKRKAASGIHLGQFCHREAGA